MKKLLILLFIIPLLAVSQNRFEKSFSELDKKQQAFRDSMLLQESLKLMDDVNSPKITLTLNEILLIKWGGYISGGVESLNKGSFDFNGLTDAIRCEKRAYLSWIKYLKTYEESETFNRPYKVKRIDEHEVQLIYKGDTIRMYLENTYQFCERLVYIKK